MLFFLIHNVTRSKAGIDWKVGDDEESEVECKSTLGDGDRKVECKNTLGDGEGVIAEKCGDGVIAKKSRVLL